MLLKNEMYIVLIQEFWLHSVFDEAGIHWYGYNFIKQTVLMFLYNTWVFVLYEHCFEYCRCSTKTAYFFSQMGSQVLATYSAKILDILANQKFIIDHIRKSCISILLIFFSAKTGYSCLCPWGIEYTVALIKNNYHTVKLLSPR